MCDQADATSLSFWRSSPGFFTWNQTHSAVVIQQWPHTAISWVHIAVRHCHTINTTQASTSLWSLQQQIMNKKRGERGREEDSQLSSCMVQVWMSIGKFFKSIGQERIRVSLRRKQKRPEERNVKRTERLKKETQVQARKSSEEVGKRARADLIVLSLKPGCRIKLLVKTCEMLSVPLMFVRRHFIHRLQTR